MFETKEVKNLIIVCDDKRMEYANFLIQLIGQKDDKEEVIGVKDGAVVAAIWTEKEYKNSLSKITSNTHILFIGDSKLVKSIENTSKIKFDKYGMRYGWLGKRAIMTIDEKKLFNEEEYNEFVSFAEKYQQIFDVKAFINFKKDFSHLEEMPRVKNLVSFSTNVLNKLLFGEVVHNQQYSCLTMVLYLEGLKDFLEA